jgi:tetratricopeptide (TPR) repeat protein
MGLGARDCWLMAALVLGLSAPAAAAPVDRVICDSSLSPLDRARFLVERGLAHEMLGEHDGALVDFTEAINVHALPNAEQARAYYDRGVTLDEMSRTDEALSDYSAALNLDPAYAAAFNNRGNAYRRLGKLDRAMADYQASLAAGNPHAEYPNYGLGQIAEAQGQLDLAREHYRAALAADPQFGLAADRLAALGDSSAAPVVLHPPPVASATSDDISLKPPKSGSARARAVRLGSATLKPAVADPNNTELDQMIQLGAWRGEADAAGGWNRAQATGGDLLANLSPQILPVDLPGKGVLYRLRAGPVHGGTASRLCEALRAKGQACVVVRD